MIRHLDIKGQIIHIIEIHIFILIEEKKEIQVHLEKFIQD